MDELVKDFLLESTENLDRLDQEFVKLESDPENRELLKSIFRTIHTIKGTCGFLGFTKLEALTHAGESLLSLLRDGELQSSEAGADVLLEMVDAVRRYLKEIEANGQEGDADTSELIVRLKELQRRDHTERAPTSKESTPVPPPEEKAAVNPNAKGTRRQRRQPKRRRAGLKRRRTPNKKYDRNKAGA